MSTIAVMDFLHRFVPAVRKEMHRVVLASNYGLDSEGVRYALDQGINSFYYVLRSGALKEPLAPVIREQRDRIVLLGSTTTAYFGGSVRRAAERTLKALQTDYLDVFNVGWLGVAAAWTDGVVNELVKLRESGKVRAIGVSIHDRIRAGKLAKESPLDLLMIRYNAAHPGAERDIFPSLSQADHEGVRSSKPAILAYTATSWRKLLKTPSGWSGVSPSAADCYRFCLSNPHVDAVLCAPSSKEQLAENLRGVSKGVLSEEEMKWMRDFGRTVHG